MWIKCYSSSFYYIAKCELKSFCWNSCLHFHTFKWKSRLLVCMYECSFVKVYVYWVPLGHWRWVMLFHVYTSSLLAHTFLSLIQRICESWNCGWSHMHKYVCTEHTKSFNHSWTANFILCRFILSLFYSSLNEMKTKLLTQCKCNHVTWIFGL